jgi:hypothetical protein
MANCGSCGAALYAGVNFCTQCGASAATAKPPPSPQPPSTAPPPSPPPPLAPPPPAPPLPLRVGGRTQPFSPPAPPALSSTRLTATRRRTTIGRRRIVLLGATAALLITLLVVWNDDDPVTGRPGSDIGSGSDPGGTSATPAAPTSPEQALRAAVEADLPAAEALVGSWVPQLSSKRLGMVIGGTTYGYPEIYADFQAMKARYPDALIVWSGDFTSFRSGDFWVMVVPTGFATGEEANGWCDRQGIAAGDCYAKRLSHTGGYAENTLHRG